MRVPLLIRYPAAVRPGQSDALVQNIDLLPTLLDLCAIAAPPHVDGRSFTGLLNGSAAAAFRDQVVTVMHRTIMLATRDWKLVYTSNSKSDTFLELYDRHERPLEVNNRAGDPARAGVLREMESRFSAWLHENGYPYAGVLDQRLPTARTRSPSAAEMVWPRVAAFQAARDARGQAVAEFTVEWNVGESLAGPVPEGPVAEGPVAEGPIPYWTFVHVLQGPQQQIVTRATLWPDPPTTAWMPGGRRTVGPLRAHSAGDRRAIHDCGGAFFAGHEVGPAGGGRPRRVVGTLTVKNRPAESSSFPSRRKSRIHISRRFS